MPPLLTGLIGFLFTLAGLSLFGTASFSIVALLYATSLYLLFYASRTSRPLAFLVGITVAMELLGTHRFGQASLLCLLTAGTYRILGEQLRFTSLYVRYIVSVLVCFGLYNLLLFPIHSYVDRLPILITPLILTCVGSYLFTLALREPNELI